MIARLNIRVKKMSLDEYEQRKEERTPQSTLDVINTVLCVTWLRNTVCCLIVSYYCVCRFLGHRN